MSSNRTGHGLYPIIRRIRRPLLVPDDAAPPVVPVPPAKVDKNASSKTAEKEGKEDNANPETDNRHD
jgi:hypothetical protein